ncbi:MAG: serine/threonine-protein kinase [Phycisphaerales bacterium]|nr:serine/threonine-protein kinase [Phycisphaerales bacterium]
MSSPTNPNPNPPEPSKKPSAQPPRADLAETSPIAPTAGARGNGGAGAGGMEGAEGTRATGGAGGSGEGIGSLTGGPLTDSKSGSKGDPNERTRTATSNIDTFVGRLVVDQGLATPEEVQQCLEHARLQVQEENQRSLVELLVSNDYITKRQATRLKTQAEAERGSQQIPGYKVLSKLGQGAMATVWRARQLSLDRHVAIKVLPRKFTHDVQFIERFYAEGRAAAQLNHPNIVQAYDVGKAGEFHFFVMEFVDGRTVFDDIDKHKRYPEKEAIEIALQVAEALQHAHERDLIHRDVKPKNIMLTKEGVAKLADMGLARALSDFEAAEAEKGKAFGTPYYISPEQIRGEVKIGPPADIYSLGATLYHMVTGAVPFDGKNPSDVMHKHLKGELVAPDHVNPKLSAGISEVIEMMMAKDPRKRYQAAKDLIVDLRAVREGRHPPIAHKDVGGLDMAALAKAEASAEAEIQVDSSAGSGHGIAVWLFATMCVLLVVSVIVNFVLFFARE